MVAGVAYPRLATSTQGDRIQPRARRAAPITSMLMALVVAACGGGPGATTAGATSGTGGNQPTGGPVTDLTRLCDLLGPGDFAAVGIEGAGAVTANTDGPGSAYCVYKGTSAATGGIEFDVFVDEDAKGTFDTIVGETASSLTPLPLPGVDEAVGTDGTAGQTDAYATIVVRKANLVFTIAAPGGSGMQAKLGALVAVVLARAAGLIA
jgi:hypothetical protein